MKQDLKKGFPPVSSPDARILILGSMPGEASLEAGQYYAHPRNAFWSIMEFLLGVEPDLDYPARVQLLIREKVALWDVISACQRPGSLDASIIGKSLVVNDFQSFFEAHPGITAVFFNGSRAESDFNRYVWPVLIDYIGGVERLRLPSTSPAMASLSQAQKRAVWAVILDKLSEPGQKGPK